MSRAGCQDPEGTSVALAIFVKTPGASPIKTRLAADMDQKIVAEFYEKCLSVMQAIANEICRTADREIVPHWAVAEPDELDNPRWQGLAQVDQGEGDLGARLNHVYQKLRERFDYVIFLGADAPQVSPHAICDSVALLDQGADFVFGPASDGGFYLFAGSKDIPANIWLETPYSHMDTLAELSGRLRRIGEVARMAELADVDDKTSLYQLRENLSRQQAGALLPEQIHLAKWLRQELPTDA